MHAQVGPDGAVWFSDWYNFIIQHNPTPQGFSNGAGNAYEIVACAINRAAASTASPTRTRRRRAKRSLSKNDTAGLLERAGVRQHAVAAARAAAARRARPEGRRAAADRAGHRTRSVDAIGINGGAHARAVDAARARRDRRADDRARTAPRSRR